MDKLTVPRPSKAATYDNSPAIQSGSHRDILSLMFSLLRPSQSSILHKLEMARQSAVSYGIALNTQSGPDGLHVPHGFVRDHSRSEIGHGAAAFEAAKSA